MIYQPQAHTAIYNPAINSWTAGPDIPTHEGSGDTALRQPASGRRRCLYANQSAPGTNGDRLARANARYASRRIRNHDASARRQRRRAAADQCPPWVSLIKAYEFDGTDLIHEIGRRFLLGRRPSDLLLLRPAT